MTLLRELAVACRPPSGELTHAPANPTCTEPRSGFLDGVEGGQGGRRRRRRCVVFKVFSQDRVLQRFVEQIIDEDAVVEEIVKIFSQDGEWVQQRFVELNHEAPSSVWLVRSLAWVWWRRSPTCRST